MKKLYIITLLSFSFGSFAQLEIHLNGQPLGSSMTIDSASLTVENFLSDLHIVNIGATSEDVSFSRFRDYNTFGWSDQICDNMLCFNCSDNESWERPSSPVLTIPAGDSSVFQLKVYPNLINGCAIYTYNIYDANKDLQDFVQITFTLNGLNCLLDTEEEIGLEYSVYPNPVSDVLNINISDASNNDMLVVYDILGKKVKQIKLSDGLNELNVSDLNNGVYFYSVISNNEAIETKKIVVRH